MIIANKPFVTITLEEQDNLLVVEWRGHIPETDFKRTFESIRDIATQRKIQKILHDISQSGPFNSAMQDYLVITGNHELRAAGILYIAYVQPARAVVQMVLATLLPSMRQAGFVTTVVATLAEARRWLRTPSNSLS